MIKTTTSKRGNNIIISAPSGVGKSTIINKLIKNDLNLQYSVSATTRKPRQTEKEGIHYYFKTQAEFSQLVDKKAFIEYAEVFGNFYGTLIEDVEKRLQSGNDVLFDIDWQGASVLKHKMPEDTISIFILPPSIEELERRLRFRNQDNEETIQYRMTKSKSEISHYHQYNYIVINDDLNTALHEITAIILANRLKKERILNLEEFIENL